MSKSRKSPGPHPLTQFLHKAEIAPPQVRTWVGEEESGSVGQPANTSSTYIDSS